MAAVLQAGNCLPVSVLVWQPHSVYSPRASHSPMDTSTFLRCAKATCLHFPPLLFPSCLTWSLTFGKGKLRRKENGKVRFDLKGWWHL